MLNSSVFRFHCARAQNFHELLYCLPSSSVDAVVSHSKCHVCVWACVFLKFVFAVSKATVSTNKIVFVREIHVFVCFFLSLDKRPEWNSLLTSMRLYFGLFAFRLWDHTTYLQTVWKIEEYLHSLQRYNTLKCKDNTDLLCSWIFSKYFFFFSEIRIGEILSMGFFWSATFILDLVGHFWLHA